MEPHDDAQSAFENAADATDPTASAAIRDLLVAQPHPGLMPEAVRVRVARALAEAAEVRSADRQLFDELGLVEEPVDGGRHGLVVFPEADPHLDPQAQVSHIHHSHDTHAHHTHTHHTHGHEAQPQQAPQPHMRARRFGRPDPVELLRRRWPVLAAAAVVLALLAIAGVQLFGQTGAGTDGLASLPGPSGGSSPTASVATSVTGGLHLQASATAYTPDTLAPGARALVTNPGPEVAPDQAASLGPLATVDGANACVAALGDADAPTVILDLATYAGQPAAVVVIARPGKTTAYAVRRDCATGDPEIIQDSVPVP